MKKILLPAVCLWWVANLFAFDYQLIRSDRTCFFSKSFGGTVYPEQRAYKIDSVKLDGSDSIFFPNINISAVEDEFGCRRGDGSWIGKRLVVKPDGTNVLYNYKNEPIELRTQAKLYETWEMYARGETIKATAEVTAIGMENILGLEDTVKTITVNVVDLRYVYKQAPPPIVLKISKHYGIIQTKAFYSFPDGERELVCMLSGLSNPKVGVQNLLWSDVWDIQPGTEVHSLYRNPYDGKLVKEKLIYGKRVVGQDFIYLSRTSFTQDSLSIDSIAPIKKDSFTVAVAKTNPNFDLLPNLPYRVGYDSNPVFGFYVQNADVKEYLRSNEYGLRDSCYSPVVWVLDINCVDCGYPYDYSYDYSCKRNLGYWKNTIVYYKKGDEEWGAPITITSMASHQIEKDISVAFLPSTGELKAVVPVQMLPATIYVMDLTGKLLLSKSLTEEQSAISTQDLGVGAYLYKVVAEQYALKSGRLFKRR